MRLCFRRSAQCFDYDENNTLVFSFLDAPLGFRAWRGGVAGDSGLCARHQAHPLEQLLRVPRAGCKAGEGGAAAEFVPGGHHGAEIRRARDCARRFGGERAGVPHHRQGRGRADATGRLQQETNSAADCNFKKMGRTRRRVRQTLGFRKTSFTKTCPMSVTRMTRLSSALYLSTTPGSSPNTASATAWIILELNLILEVQWQQCIQINHGQ